MPGRTIEQVLKEKTGEWMAVPGVEGVGIGMFEGSPCIRVFASANPQDVRQKIPPLVENYPVVVEETGSFHNSSAGMITPLRATNSEMRRAGDKASRYLKVPRFCSVYMEP